MSITSAERIWMSAFHEFL